MRFPQRLYTFRRFLRELEKIGDKFRKKIKKKKKGTKSSIRTKHFSTKIRVKLNFPRSQAPPRGLGFIVNSRLTWFTFIHSRSMLLDWAFRPLNSIHHTSWWIEYEGERAGERLTTTESKFFRENLANNAVNYTAYRSDIEGGQNAINGILYPLSFSTSPPSRSIFH